MPPDRPGLDVIIRVHDPARLPELSRAVFSVLMGDYRPLTVQIVCQRFGPPQLGAVRQVLAPLMAIAGDAAACFLNCSDPVPQDARAFLLNQGLRAGQGRYAAALDYNDLIYPEAYRLLIAELESSGAAIAFGGILHAYVSRSGLVPVTTAKRRVFGSGGLPRLLRDGNCPLQSVVLDRRQIAPAVLAADESLAASADDDLLLRLCARYPGSFRLQDTIIGEHIVDDHGSPVDSTARPESPELTARKAHLVLSPAVQATLGLNEPGLTVTEFLARTAPPCAEPK